MGVRQIEVKAEVVPFLKRRLALHGTAFTGQLINVTMPNRSGLGQGHWERNIKARKPSLLGRTPVGNFQSHYRFLTLLCAVNPPCTAVTVSLQVPH